MAVLASCSSSGGGGGGVKELSCPSDQKVCDGKCVSRMAVEFGCGDDSCEPCTLESAETMCDSKGDCRVKSCLDNALDCNGFSNDGCEVRPTVDDCGACGMTCRTSAPHTRGATCTTEDPNVETAGAGAGGAAGMLPPHCGISCEPGYLDADSDPRNGCEKALLLTHDVRCDPYPPQNKSACGLFDGVECAYSSPASDCIETFDCIGNGTASYWQLQGAPCP